MTLDEIFEKAAGKLPMVPKVVQELLASFERSDTSVDAVVEQVSHDQVLSAKVLRLANSTKISGGRKVHNIEDAVVRMGFDSLRMLVVAGGMAGMQVSSPSFDKAKFWLLSFKTSNVAKQVAKLAGLDPNNGYTCGLLFNIGELLIHIALPDEMVRIDKMVSGGADRYQVENMVLGLDLATVGGELAKRWQFPLEIVRAITQQQNPLNYPEFEPYAGLIAVCNLLVMQFEAQLSDEDIGGLLPNALLEKLCLPPETLIAVLPKLREATEGLEELV